MEKERRTTMKRTKFFCWLFCLFVVCLVFGSESLCFVPVAHAGMSVVSVQNPSNDHVYHLIRADDGVSGLTWMEAEQTAISLGGHLTTIRSAAENAWVTSTFKDPYLWIGLNDAASEGHFVWSSGEPVVYTNWHPGEPNNSEGEENYVAIYNFDSGRREWNDWKDRTTYMQWPFYGIAEIVPPPPPPPPQFYAVIIGIADGQIRGDKDAKAINDVFLRYPGVNPDNIKLILNPTQLEAIKITLDEVIEKLRPQDRFLFYYSGHGAYGLDETEPAVWNSPSVILWSKELKNQGDEYLVFGPKGARVYMSDDQLTHWLSTDPKMDNVQKLVILDSCMSGGFWGLEGNEADVGDLDKLKNIGLITACDERNFAYAYPDWSWLGERAGRGLFSWELEKALRLRDNGIAPADLNKDGSVSFEELRERLWWDYIMLEEGEVGIIKGFPWLEEDIEVEIGSLGLYANYGTEFNPSAPIVPEPGTLILLGLGGLTLIHRKRR